MADPHDDDLLDDLVGRLEADGLDPEVEALALGAILGESELAEVLGGRPVAAPGHSGTARAPLPRTYLSDIEVEGFRGIGGKARIGLQPGPGLTLVVGRNGSGKSSFAEAVELAMTGTNLRWAGGKSKVWEDGWKNLHHPGARSIVVRLSTDGDPMPTTVSRRWEDGAPLTGGTATIQRKGDPARPLTEAGWARALSTYRPFLSYNELGGLLEDGPSKLYDAISRVLGLDLLASAEKRLTEARKQLGDQRKAAEDEAARLVAILGGIDDPRAATCAAALDRRGGWDIDMVGSVVTPTAATSDDTGLNALRALAILEAPDVAAAHRAAARLRDVIHHAQQLRGTDAERARDLADLLDQALRFHDPASTACDVCGTAGVADAAWFARTEAEVSRLRTLSTAAEAATHDLEAATREARSVVGPPPAALSARVGVDTSAALEAWEAWAGAPDDPAELAAHLEGRADKVADATVALRRAAATELTRREDRWAPVAAALAAWVPQARAAQAAAPRRAQVNKALDWLRGTSNELRNQRFAPIAAQVRATWDLLRQQSNVSIDELVLAGSSNRRRVELKVTVDQVEGAALAVMSQGELHAMALSLFLPRATLSQSPFGFLVIDDPVQSMDAARVDGLARALDAVAATHQVIVFTHDERLPQAARLLRLPVRVLEVTRAENSSVTVRSRSTPARDYLDDARAILRTEDFPAGARRRVVPGLCRSSLESVCIDVTRRRRLAAGARHQDVESLIGRVTKPLPWLALALFDDEARAGEVLGEVNRRWGGAFADVIQALRTGAHRLIDDDPNQLVTTTTALVDKLDELA